MELLSAEIGDEITFYSIEIKAKTTSKGFFVAKINRYLDIIDYEKSDAEIIDGEPFLATMDNVVYNENLPEFFITRDCFSQTDWYISDKLKTLIDRHQLKIKALEC